MGAEGQVRLVGVHMGAEGEGQLGLEVREELWDIVKARLRVRAWSWVEKLERNCRWLN